MQGALATRVQGALATRVQGALATRVQGALALVSTYTCIHFFQLEFELIFTEKSAIFVNRLPLHPRREKLVPQQTATNRMR